MALLTMYCSLSERNQACGNNEGAVSDGIASGFYKIYMLFTLKVEEYISTQ
jgi:hypothetical protein